MSSPKLPPIRTAGDRADISIRDATMGWLGAWLVGTVLASAIYGMSGKDSVAEAGPGWLAAGAVAAWVPALVMIWFLGKRDGVGNLAADYGMSFRPLDLIGVPIGIITQLVFVRLVYLPLEGLWPDTFTMDRIEQRARDTYESASGGGVVLLVLVVAVGAPLVEELTYRGLLQGAFTRRLDDSLGVVVVALWFALIHFQPVEIPGLFVVGLVLGACATRTGRLGMSVLAHVAFNATGLVLVAAT